jgi:fumarate hydratase class II
MNLALADQIGTNHVQVPSARLQNARTQRPHVNFSFGAERLLWVPAAILALGIFGKYVAPSIEDLGQLPKEKAVEHDERDLLTRVREAGW